MTTPLIVVGAGGFGREVLDVVEAMNERAPGPVLEICGVSDDSPHIENLSLLKKRGITYLGTIDEVLESLDAPSSFLIGVGNPGIRFNIAKRMARADLGAATAIHPTSVIGSHSFIGAGSVVCAGVNISTNVFLNEHVHLNPGAIIGHDSRIGSSVSINPGAIVSGNVILEPGCLIGAGATILQGIRVGANSVVGAGAVVTRDVEPNTTVKGIPAR